MCQTVFVKKSNSSVLVHYRIARARTCTQASRLQTDTQRMKKEKCEITQKPSRHNLKILHKHYRTNNVLLEIENFAIKWFDSQKNS